MNPEKEQNEALASSRFPEPIAPVAVGEYPANPPLARRGPDVPGCVVEEPRRNRGRGDGERCEGEEGP